MLIIKFTIILIMLIGLMCTLAPKLYGTVTILIAALVYAFIGVSVWPLWVEVSLFLLTFIAEIGSKGLGMLLMRHSEVSRKYSIDTTVCNLAGIVVADALLGSLVGLTLWEALVGKNLFPRLDSISKVLIRLIIIAVLRLTCGLLMIIIVVKYMM